MEASIIIINLTVFLSYGKNVDQLKSISHFSCWIFLGQTCTLTNEVREEAEQWRVRISALCAQIVFSLWKMSRTTAFNGIIRHSRHTQLNRHETGAVQETACSL